MKTLAPLIALMLVLIGLGGYFLLAEDGDAQRIGLADDEGSSRVEKDRENADKDAESKGKKTSVSKSFAADPLKDSAAEEAAKANKSEKGALEGGSDPLKGTKPAPTPEEELKAKIKEAAKSKDPKKAIEKIVAEALKNGGLSGGAVEIRRGGARNREVKRTPFEAQVSGTIYGEDGEVIAGATITPIAPSAGGANFYAMAGDMISTIGQDSSTADLNGLAQTSANGEFALDLNGQMREKSEEGRIALSIEAEGYGKLASEGFSIRRSGSRESIEIRLYKSVTVTGRVLDAKDKTAFEGARVSISRGGNVFRQRSGNRVGLAFSASPITTNADGIFTFKNVPGGKLTLSASLPAVGQSAIFMVNTGGSGIFGSSGGAKQTVDVSKGVDPDSIELLLDRGADLLFRIEQSGVKNVRAKLIESRTGMIGFSGSFGGSDLLVPLEGVYRLPSLTTKHAKVEISADGYPKTTIDIAPKSGEDLDIGTIRLAEGVSVTGMVVDADGNPLSAATVRLIPASSTSGGISFGGNSLGSRTKSVTSDASGRFAMDGVEVGSQTFEASKDGFASSQEIITVTEEGNNDLRLTLAPGGRVYGEAKLPEAPESDMGMMNRVSLIEASRASAGSLDQLAWGAKYAASFDSQGAFSIENVPAGTYTAYAQYGGRKASVADIVVRGGDEVSVSLVFAKDGAVEGYITNRDGEPYANKAVELRSNTGFTIGGNKLSATTNAEGFYLMESVPAGEYHLAIEGDPQQIFGADRTLRLVVIKGDTKARKDLDLSNTTGVSIKGKVTLDGKTLFTSVTLYGAGQTGTTKDVNGKGEFSFDGVEGGTMYLWIHTNSGGRYSTRTTITVPTDPIDDVEFNRNFQSVTLSGKIQAEEGVNLTQATVRAKQTSGALSLTDPYLNWYSPSATSNAEGEYSMTLVVGDYDLVLSHPSFAPVTTRVSASSDLVQNLAFGQSAGTLEIHVSSMLKDGKPYSSSESYGLIEITDSEGKKVLLSGMSVYMPLKGASSKTEIPMLLPGTYQLRLRSSTFEEFNSNFSIESDKTTTVDAKLHFGATLTVKISNEEMSAELLAAAKVSIYDASSGAVVYPGNGTTAFAGATASREKRLGPLLAGSYRIKVSVTGYDDFEVNVSLTRGAAKTEEVVLTKKD